MDSVFWLHKKQYQEKTKKQKTHTDFIKDAEGEDA